MAENCRLGLVTNAGIRGRERGRSAVEGVPAPVAGIEFCAETRSDAARNMVMIIKKATQLK